MICVKTANDEMLGIEQILDLVPDNIYSSNLHIENCYLIASQKFKSHIQKKELYTNLLARNSSPVRAITAIRFLTQNKMLDIIAITVPKNIAIALVPYVEQDKIDSSQSESELLDQPSTLRIILKTGVHRLYRTLGWRSLKKEIKNNAIVRSYVEVTEGIHKDRMPESLCLFFPFAYKLSRQIDFYQYCKRKGYEVGLYGVPYSLTMLAKLLWRRTDENITEFEFEAYTKHGEELAKAEITEYFTEDDYVPAAFLVAEKLKSTGCHVINSSHGVNQVCPFVDASRIEVLTRPQLKFYSFWSGYKNIQFTFQDSNDLPSDLDLSHTNGMCFILMHGSFTEANMLYEADLQKKIFRQLERISEEHGVDVRVKYHPNTTVFENTSLPTLATASDVRSLDKLKVFLTINSTSYYTYFTEGLFLFVGDSLCNPFEIVDEAVPFFHIDELENTVIKHIEKETILKKLKVQQALMQDKDVQV